jgi:hypothetical protein
MGIEDHACTLFLVTHVSLHPAKCILIASTLLASHLSLSFSLSLSLSDAMSTRSSKQHLLPCILLLLLLAMSQLPSSSHGLRTLREEEAGHELRGRGLPPAISPPLPSREVGGNGDDDTDSIDAEKFAVSRRVVPQGPNPLHN